MVTVNQPCLSKNGVIDGLKQVLGDKFTPEVEKIINDNTIGWYSRSLATSLFAFCRNEYGKMCVLGIKRGEGCPDFNGYWNAMSGYLEFNLTCRENAVKEAFEEASLTLNPDDLVYIGFEDDPVKANRQNITMRYAYVFPEDVVTIDVNVGREHMEDREVEEIKWIPLDEITNYQWAFGHDETILEIANKLELN